MIFYSAFDFCILTPSVEELAIKLENMLMKLEHHLLITSDGRYCKIYFHQPEANVFPGVYDTQKVYEMLSEFNRHKSYLWSFLQNCHVNRNKKSIKVNG